MHELTARLSTRALVALAIAVVAPLLALTGLHPPGRLLLAVAFTLLVPGLAIVELIRLPSAHVSWCLAIALSIALNILVAQLQLTLHSWHPATGPLVLATASVVLLGFAARNRRETLTVQPAARQGARRHAATTAAAGSDAGGSGTATAVLTQTDTAPAPPARRTPDVVTYGSLALGLVLFGVSLVTTDQDAMDGFGLISVLGWPFFTALLLVCFAGAREFSRRTLRTSHMTAVLVVLIIMLFGIQNLSDSAAGFSTSWLHSGFVSYISDNGAVLRGYDARFSWPGFFGGAAALVSLGGTPDAIPLLRLAPITYNLLALIPLVLIARHVASRQHVAWLGILFYYCSNWFEQDYFAPQATNLVLYLVVVGVLLWLAHEGNPGVDVSPTRRIRRWWTDGFVLSARRLIGAVVHDRPLRMPGLKARDYVVIEVLLVIVIAASVVSHQLTPFAIILALIGFSFSARTRFKGLWIVAALTFIGWFSYGATDYWFGHLGTVLGDVGQVGGTVSKGVGERVSGDPAHVNMQHLRVGMSAGIAGLALIGLFVRRSSPWLPLFAALAFGPFMLLGLQSYGGEVVIRCFLFATPLLALLAAEAFRWVFSLSREAVAVIVLVGLFAACLMQVAARGANQPFERITSDQVAAVHTIHERTTPDSLVGYFNDFTPLPLLKPGSLSVENITDPDCAEEGAVTCALETTPDFIYASSSQAAYGVLVEGEPADWMDDIVDGLVASGRYRAIIDTTNVTVLELIPGSTAVGGGIAP